MIPGFALPDLDYDQPAFDLGLLDRRPTASPTYKAPSPAREGFTRSPKEDDVLVCPNCGDDLCVGDSDVKRQAWVVKACGHVYCGECAANRQKAKRKGKEPMRTKSKPFVNCQVPGCDKTKVSSKNQMIQLFL